MDGTRSRGGKGGVRNRRHNPQSLEGLPYLELFHAYGRILVINNVGCEAPIFYQVGAKSVEPSLLWNV